jgi:hypothetical protein
VHQLADERDNIALCAKIQTALLRRIVHVEGRIRIQRLQSKSLRHALATKTQPHRTRSAASELKRSVARIDARVAEYQQLLRVLRSVGDAIAFVYIDKWDIKPLAFREAPGFLSGKLGLKQEIRLARWAWRRGIPLVVNDLTTCLRYGDVTVPRGDGKFILVELKATRKGSRGHKQERAMSKIQSYLATDEATDLYGQVGPFRRYESATDERNHRAALNTLIGNAHEAGVAYSEVEHGLFYVCSEHSTDLTQVVLDIRGRCRETPIVGVVNEAKWDEGGYFPYTLSISDPDAAIRFWEGFLVISIVIDPATIHDGFALRGYRAELDLDSHRPLSLYSPRSPNPGGLVLNVGTHYFNRVFTEFLSLDWMISEILRHPLEEMLLPASGSELERILQNESTPIG